MVGGGVVGGGPTCFAIFEKEFCGIYEYNTFYYLKPILEDGRLEGKEIDELKRNPNFFYSWENNCFQERVGDAYKLLKDIVDGKHDLGHSIKVDQEAKEKIKSLEKCNLKEWWSFIKFSFQAAL